MTEVFITNIENQNQADKVAKTMRINYSDSKINIDLNETELSFPCGHAILRVEGENVNSDEIINSIKELGIKCQILEDKICI
ncbi:MAG: hypothetical protein Crog4KO_00550 [Crocinitomicaceae bacterium]